MARIHRPSRNVMQSGIHRSDLWCIEFEPSRSQYKDSLMGWVGSKDTAQQVRLQFQNKEDAVSYAKAHGITYVILPDQTVRKKPKSYSENFSKNRGL
ncbi:ETC complex I subunit [Anaplasma capra]|uniref:ETC complex I subunit n=1 Tax=Anaplasma capra TaxID=1562740 RepID=UPI0021D56B84|nr:ETC complex I subunit [Anaplasma capra]MCU7611765.1 ETC complex I subunit [Anaplasma capra]MCU7612485.1 ETC complex I subunit [Anaplasma capra]